jgi:PKHD-type hydroxylase
MLLQIPNILNEKEIAQICEILKKSSWLENKNNFAKIAQESEELKKISENILKALEQNALFISCAIPNKIFPPIFLKTDEKFQDEPKVDSAIKHLQGSAFRLRSDLNATLFLSDVNSYQGGELIIEDIFGLQKIKLPAGQLIIYPASAVNYISKITKGERLAINFTIESMIRENDKRTILFEIDSAIRALNSENPQNPVIKHLAGTYHNLVRLWADS